MDRVEPVARCLAAAVKPGCSLHGERLGLLCNSISRVSPNSEQKNPRRRGRCCHRRRPIIAFVTARTTGRGTVRRTTVHGSDGRGGKPSTCLVVVRGMRPHSQVHRRSRLQQLLQLKLALAAAETPCFRALMGR